MMKQVPFSAPDFTLFDENREVQTLSAHRGKWVVLYFYPKDDTPGCTIEACGLRDVRDTLTDLGAEVMGVSQDDAASHELFKAKHSLNFTLLSDPTRRTIEAYGAWGKGMFGRDGILRKTFIINPAGQVVKQYGKVTPLGHGKQIVEALKNLQQEV